MDRDIFKGVAIISYLTRGIKERFPNKQVGKTLIQKMIYLLTRERIADYDYSLYHYGPYSGEVNSEINFCEALGVLNIEWVLDKGYFIDVKDTSFEKFLSEEEKRKIEELISKYGNFTAIELSIITTALFIKDNFAIEDARIIEVISSIKPQHSKTWIRNVLMKAGL